MILFFAVENCFQIAVKGIAHLIVSGFCRMHPVGCPDDRFRIIRIDRLFPDGEVVFGIYVHIDGHNMYFEFSAFFQQRAIVVVQIFTILPAGLSAVVIFSECILIGSGDVLEDHDFRSRLEFAEFGNKFFHIFDGICCDKRWDYSHRS